VSTPSPVPTSSSVSSTGQSIIQFTLTAAQGSPQPIVFGDQSAPLAVSLMEIPARLSALGGVQNNAIHLFPGGYKTVQALGAFPHKLAWSGLLIGRNASARSFQLDTIRRSGVTAVLQAGPWKWQGLVTSYLADFLHQNYISYSMEFEPTVDLVSTQPASAPSVGSTMSNLLQQIQSNYASNVLLSAASQAAMLAFAGVAGPLVIAAASDTLSALTSTQVQQLQIAQSTLLGALAGDLVSSNGGTAAAALGAQAVVNGLVGSLLSNSIGTAVTLVNPNLAVVAAQYLGDASRWTDIATLNNLSDMEPSGIQSLLIPSL
jgi:hypothetical protein